MELTEQTINPKKLAINNALIWAAINIAIFLLIYYVKPELMGSFVFTGIQILIGIGLAVYFCLDMRKQVGGYWSFKEALGSIFLMFFVQAIIVFFFTIIFAKFLEPDYAVKMKEIVSVSTQEMLEKMGMDQDKIDEAMAESDKRLEEQFNPGIKQILIGLATVAIMYFVGALIFAAIFKKDRPVFLNSPEE
ncbi:DUF4199 domain-containing protein [Daejeonella oryzae]|uniref:DUF4199 domain-containing protein n=1 Tax=Daejeonella oryzae TaxID=1122943 RepID=UPI0004201D54|nr:DUF4199 domain-containing protein [Daejeonella oryzae]